ncbi:MAG: transposase, partial [Acidobacteriota bacterium]
VRENLAIRWFCGFSLTEKTPDHSYFGKFRKRIGTKHIADIFNSVNDQLRKEGLFGNIFHFIEDVENHVLRAWSEFNGFAS